MFKKMLNIKFRRAVYVFAVLVMVWILFTLETIPTFFDFGQPYCNMRTVRHNKMSASFFTSRKTPNIFYFGITHHLNREKALACQKTWVRTLPNMHWYSDKPDTDLNATVISYKGGDTYDLIVFRMVMVFEHVGKNYPDYDWYVRLWDDSYMFKERLEHILSGMSTSSPVLLGRFEKHALLNTNIPSVFVGGGAGWVFNHGALRRLYDDNGLFICNEEYMKTYLRNMVSDDQHWAEDVFISQCFLQAGIKFVFSFGFHAQTLDHATVKLTAKDAVSGKLPYQERRRSDRWNQTSFVNIPNNSTLC